MGRTGARVETDEVVQADQIPDELVLPQFFTPEELAAKAGWSPRRLRQFAREIGACRIIGNRMILTQADVDSILEASKPKPRRPTAISFNEYDERYRRAMKLLTSKKTKPRATR